MKVHQYEYILRLAIFFLMSAGFLISGTFRKKANASGGDEISFKDEGRFIHMFRSLFALAGYGGILIYLVYPPALAWAQLDLPGAIRWAGIAVMLVMLPLLYWMFSHLGNNITPTVITREGHSLVTSGPYRWIRHPLYTFGFINFFGLSLAAGNWFIFLMLALAMVTLGFRTKIEERQLLEKFGQQYQSYTNTTGRFLPKLR